MKNKKSQGIAALIVDAMPSSKKEGSDAMEDTDYSIAADEILSAIKEEDSQSLAEALKAFVDLCGSDSYEEEDEAEEEE